MSNKNQNPKFILMKLQRIKPQKKLPAEKCNGVDLRPAVSLAFTFDESTIDRTFVKSPHLQASKSSLNGSLGLILRGSDNLDIMEVDFFQPFSIHNWH